MIHALVDFSTVHGETHETVESWIGLLRSPDSLSGVAARVTCVLPPRTAVTGTPPDHWRIVSSGTAGAACCEAMTCAAQAGADLVVLFAPVLTCGETIGALVDALQEDPLFGSAHPRFASEPGLGVLPVSPGPEQEEPLPRAALSHLPARYVLPERLSGCFVLRRELVANLDLLSASGSTIPELMLDYLRRARRIGYRAIVVNSVVATLPASTSATLSRLQFGIAGDRGWDLEMARARFSRRADIEREQRLGALVRTDRRLLIDARNLSAKFNGTTTALLRLSDALYERDGWDVTFLASAEAGEAHQLQKRYSRWTMANTIPEKRAFAAAFRPSQPWDLEEVLELHQAAAVNAYLMLDSIAWDVVYTAPKRLDATWRCVAQYADALLFISEFSKRRFASRFPVHPDVAMPVCRLSVDYRDYIDNETEPAAPAAPYWFIVGNEYDHKHVRPTVGLLARAFPTTRLVVLGDGSNAGQVTTYPSGRTSERQVQQLYAGAGLVIFPSFYEGFGLPVVNALAYGKTVVTRDTELLREVADVYTGPGRIVPFTTPDELVERLASLRHGLPVPELTLNRAPAPANWASAAAVVDDALRALVNPRGVRRERDRHELISLLDAWKSD